MSVEVITDHFVSDITITRARYGELLKAEHDAECLKDLIKQKAKRYESLDNREIRLLKELYFYEMDEEEGEE